MLRLISGSFNDACAVAFLKASLERVNQPLPDILPGYQPIDHDENVVEVLELIIIGRMQLDRLTGAEEAGEAALHQAHDVGSNRAAWG